MKVCAGGRPESIEIPAPARMKYRRSARSSLARAEVTRRLPFIEVPRRTEALTRQEVFGVGPP